MKNGDNCGTKFESVDGYAVKRRKLKKNARDGTFCLSLCTYVFFNFISFSPKRGLWKRTLPRVSFFFFLGRERISDVD